MLPQVSWIDVEKLSQFILKAQDSDGGISDRPGNMSDIFHTFFGIAGLSLLGFFDTKENFSHFKKVDPTYALPDDIVRGLGLAPQVFTELVIVQEDV